MRVKSAFMLIATATLICGTLFRAPPVALPYGKKLSVAAGGEQIGQNMLSVAIVSREEAERVRSPTPEQIQEWIAIAMEEAEQDRDRQIASAIEEAERERRRLQDEAAKEVTEKFHPLMWIPVVISVVLATVASVISFAIVISFVVVIRILVATVLAQRQSDDTKSQ